MRSSCPDSWIRNHRSASSSRTQTGIPILLILSTFRSNTFQAGIRTSIYEKESQGYQSNREWTCAIHWSVPHLKTLLPSALYERLHEAYCDPFSGAIEKTTIYNSASGEVLKELFMPGMIRVDRNRMRRLCSEGLDVNYSKALSGLEYGVDGQGVTARFADGTVAEGDILVGADGPQSAVRIELFGKEAAASKSSNLVSFLSTVNYKNAEKARHVRSGNPIFCMAYNPAGIMNFISGKLNSTKASRLVEKV
jgi:hypothetical protein